MIDNAWAVATRRADRAALELAQVLVSRVHGHRPVTLVGVYVLCVCGGGGRVCVGVEEDVMQRQ